MKEITIYTTSWCPTCANARAFFDNKGVDYTDVDVELWADPRGKLEAITGKRTVPQIVIGDTHVGGFDDLLWLHQDGVLDEMLKTTV